MKLSWVELIGLTSGFLEGNTLNFEVNGKEVKIKYDDDHERIVIFINGRKNVFDTLSFGHSEAPNEFYFPRQYSDLDLDKTFMKMYDWPTPSDYDIDAEYDSNEDDEHRKCRYFYEEAINQFVHRKLEKIKVDVPNSELYKLLPREFYEIEDYDLNDFMKDYKELIRNTYDPGWLHDIDAARKRQMNDFENTWQNMRTGKLDVNDLVDKYEDSIIDALTRSDSSESTEQLEQAVEDKGASYWKEFEFIMQQETEAIAKYLKRFFKEKEINNWEDLSKLILEDPSSGKEDYGNSLYRFLIEEFIESKYYRRLIDDITDDVTDGYIELKGDSRSSSDDEDKDEE